MSSMSLQKLGTVYWALYDMFSINKLRYKIRRFPPYGWNDVEKLINKVFPLLEKHESVLQRQVKDWMEGKTW